LEEERRRLEHNQGEMQDRLGQEMAGSARLRAEISAAQVRGELVFNAIYVFYIYIMFRRLYAVGTR